MKALVDQGFKQLFRRIFVGSISLILLAGLWGCGDRLNAKVPSGAITESQPVVTAQLAEVPTPKLIQELRKELDPYQPQVKILSPAPDTTFSQTTVALQLQVKDLPLFQDPELGLGPHLELFLDDQPYREIYDVSEPIILENLTPGSHLIRVFASRPWHESFKNEGAFAETRFHIFTKTATNLPVPDQPLLTYSRPQGTYGAEPIMLDFYLTNAPLHFIAQESPDDSITDWRIRVTVNGESFVVDSWQPVYLKGFKEGENWLKLELLDDQGELVGSPFNNPVSVIQYDPKRKDSLAKLVQNKFSLKNALRIVQLSTQPTPAEPELDTVEPESEIILPSQKTDTSSELKEEIMQPSESQDVIEPESELESESGVSDTTNLPVEIYDSTQDTEVEIVPVEIPQSEDPEANLDLEEKESTDDSGQDDSTSLEPEQSDIKSMPLDGGLKEMTGLEPLELEPSETEITTVEESIIRIFEGNNQQPSPEKEQSVIPEDFSEEEDIVPTTNGYGQE